MNSRIFVFTLSSSRSVSLTWLLLLILLPSFSVSDVFTSTNKIFTAAMQETNLLDHLQSYINDEYDNLKTLINFLTNQTKKQHEMSHETIIKMAQHPNGAFILIKRFVTSWQHIMKSNPDTNQSMSTNSDVMGNIPTYVWTLDVPNSTITNTTYAMTITHLFSNKIENLDLQLPTLSDLSGAADALIRLQRVYLLRAEDMYVGNYSGHLGPPLEPLDTHIISKQAFEYNYIKESIEWLELARDKMLEERETTEDKKYWSKWRIAAALGGAYVLMNRTDEARELYAEILQSGETNDGVEQLERDLKKQHAPKTDNPEEVALHNNMIELCSQDKNHRVADIRSYHICRYKPSIYLPYLRFEEEILSLEPFASLFYNVISDQDAELIKTFMSGKLERGRIVSGKKNVVSEVRTSDVGWLDDKDLDVARKMSKRIQAITWLDASPLGSEPYQVVNYGIGGHYGAHWDTVTVKNSSKFVGSRHRLATFLIYLSDVEKGGHTVFLQSGISVAPQKGMALFWYNHHPSLKSEYLTQHASCPVLIGQKWVANKWIRSSGNMFTRPCGPRPTSTQLDIENLMYSRLRK